MHSITLFFVHYFFFVFFFAFAMLSHKVYIHRCELKTSLVEIFISAKEKFSTPSEEPAGFCRNPIGNPIRNLRQHSTSPCVHVQVCKYVVIFFAGPWKPHFSFIQARNTRNRWRDRSERCRRGRKKSLPVFRPAYHRSLRPQAHHNSANPTFVWNAWNSVSNTLCQIRDTFDGQIW